MIDLPIVREWWHLYHLEWDNVVWQHSNLHAPAAGAVQFYCSYRPSFFLAPKCSKWASKGGRVFRENPMQALPKSILASERYSSLDNLMNVFILEIFFFLCCLTVIMFVISLWKLRQGKGWGGAASIHQCNGECKGKPPTFQIPSCNNGASLAVYLHAEYPSTKAELPPAPLETLQS